MVESHNTGSPIGARLRPVWGLVLFIMFLVVPAYCQSLGDIARQELERKQAQPQHSTHVYDNDDLARPQILIPEDLERVGASKKKLPAGSEVANEEAGSDHNLHAPPPAERLPHRTSEIRIQQPGPLPLHLELRSPALGDLKDPRSPDPHSLATASRDVSVPRTDAWIPRAHDVSNAIPFAKIPRRETPAAQNRVRVQPGDTLWKLASKYLGQGKDWLVLAVHNPQVTDPERLQVGTWLLLPDQSPDPRPPDRVRVKPGDSLWKLAEARFGDGMRWSCVADANPQLRGAHLIFPGQILEIPDNCAAKSSAKIRPPESISTPLPTSIARFTPQAN